MAVIDKLRNGKVGKIWEVRKKVLGGKNTMMQATAIINPETGRLAVTKDEALNATLKYCKETLKNNEPNEDFKKEVEKKKEEVTNYLQLKEGQFSATKETFNRMIVKFRKSSFKKKLQFSYKS